MKQKHSLFSFSLMREGFRQCQTIGIFALVLIMLGAVLVPVGYVINTSNESHFTKLICESYMVNPLLCLVALAVPLMTLVLFHFLDNRAASDLYHALPHKRIALYVSYAASILAWVLLLLVAGTVTSLITCAVTHNYLVVMYHTILPYLGVIFMLCLLLMCGILLAMSISGTVFTNILLSLILLFLPRICLLSLRYVLSTNMPFYISMNSDGFFADTSNILFSFVVALLGNAGGEIFSPSWQAYVYTFLLSMLYFAVGAWMFCIRRSEAAGQPAPSRIIQHIYRIVVTMTYCVFVTGALYISLRDGMDGNALFTYVVLYLVAVLIYCFYELLTTKKWKSVLHSLPLLGVVAVLNVGVLLGMYGIGSKIINKRPSVEEIQSISIQNDSSDYGDYGNFLTYRSYVDLLSKDIEIQDPSALAMVSYYLNENIQTWEKGTAAYYDKYCDDAYVMNATYCSYYVTIRTKDNDTFCRQIWIPRNTRNVMTEALKSNEDFVRAWTELPEVLEDSLIATYTGGPLSIDEKQTEALFAKYKEELAKCSFEQIYNASESYSYNGLEFEYSIMVNKKQYTLNCPVYTELMPETMKMFYEDYYAANKEDASKVIELLGADVTGSYQITAYSADGSKDASRYADNANFKDDVACTLLQKYILDRPRKSGDAYVEVWLYPNDDSAEETDSYWVELPLAPAFFEDEQVKSYFNYYREEYAAE